MPLLTLKFSRSWYLIYFLVFIHLGAIACLWLLPIAGIVVATFGITGSFFYQIRNAAAIIQLQTLSDGNWELTNRSGETIAARLLGDSLVTAYLVVLNFQSLSQKQRLSIVIFPDRLNPTDFRRLQMVLRCGAVCPTAKYPSATKQSDRKYT